MIQERDDIVALDSAIIQHPRTWEAAGTWPASPIRWSTAARAGSASAPTTCGELECGRKPSKHPGEDAAVRPDRGARVQPDVRDDDRPGEGGRLDRLPAPGDGAGHLPRLQAGAAVRAPQAAVRHRAGRQVVPQRDHAGQLHLPHARVRADGDGVLRPARRGRSSGTSTGCRSASSGTCGSGIDREQPAPARRTTRTSSRTTRAPPATSSTSIPIGWSELEGIANRGDFDLTQHARVLGREARVRRPADRRALRPARDRAGRRRRPPDPRAAVRRLRRGRDRRRAAHRAAPAPGARAGQGRRAAAAAQGRPPGARARGLRGAAPARQGRVRRGRRDRQPLPPPGRDRHAVRGHDRPPDARGPHSDTARPRHARAGARGDRRARASCCADRLRSAEYRY